MPHEIAPRITIDPEVRFGKPVIKGTRVPVETIIARLAEGLTPDVISEEYGVTNDDVRAALLYAASVIGGEEIRSLP
ncbi:MAG: DUF433 domain-containing protein [Dehalococcoidia bacterium]